MLNPRRDQRVRFPPSRCFKRTCLNQTVFSMPYVGVSGPRCFCYAVTLFDATISHACCSVGFPPQSDFSSESLSCISRLPEAFTAIADASRCADFTFLIRLAPRLRDELASLKSEKIIVVRYRRSTRSSAAIAAKVVDTHRSCKQWSGAHFSKVAVGICGTIGTIGAAHTCRYLGIQQIRLRRR
jgi:hypothetical protein